MADITYSDLVKESQPVDVSEDGMALRMNRYGTSTFSITTAKVQVSTGEQAHAFTARRGVIYAKNGAKILPYFEREERTYVVMVEQFRIALPGKTLEPAGGEANPDVDPDVRTSMARELEEEAHITVRLEEIRVVFTGRIQPSMMPSKASGGIVRITESQLPKELVHGEHQFGEYTVVGIYPFLDLLRARDAGELDLDLETWLLLDGLAKELGLLLKRY